MGHDMLRGMPEGAPRNRKARRDLLRQQGRLPATGATAGKISKSEDANIPGQASGTGFLEAGASQPESKMESRAPRINKADSLTITGIILTAVLYAVLPTLWARLASVIFGLALATVLVIRSEWSQEWSLKSKCISQAVLIVVGIGLCIPLVNEWTASNRKSSSVSGGGQKLQVIPAVSWPTPRPVRYGTQMSTDQLNATSAVDGSFAYSPSIGTILPVGTHTIVAVFTPT